jgi:eukaryotic-like serine/threonine-protein kinase
VAPTEVALADVAAAILDGTPIDWAAAESSAGESDRRLLHRLKRLAAVADFHRSLAQPDAAPVGAIAGVESPGRWGHLRVLERIGRGAFGEVYRAWDARLDREVALKLLRVPASGCEVGGTTFIEEGRALARVRHPNVVTLYGAEVIDDRVGLWMELIRGRTLDQLVAGGRRWSADEAAALGVELCRAVSAVHEAGLLHRDIKASNVMVAEDGGVVLMDFGTGAVLADGAEAPLAGTPLYLAPELLAGGNPSASSDLYGIGVVLHYLVSGSYPVQARDLEGVRLAHERGDRTPVRRARPDLPARFARVIDRATDPDPAHRYPTADALGAELASLAPRPRTSVRVRGLVAALALLLAFGLAWEIRGRLAEDPSPSPGRGTKPARALLGAAEGERRVEPPAIVVLPFDDLGGEPDSDVFADGLADEIIRDLARVEGLAVRSRYSSFLFRGKSRDLRTVGDRLGVNHAVTGSVLRSGRRLRVNAQLVELDRDVPLWAQRFDREVATSGDVLAIVDEIARAIVNELRLTLGRGQRRYDLDLATYEKYLEARTLVERRGEHAPKLAAALFEEIIEADPAFAPAHAGLADAYAFLSMVMYQSGITANAALAVMRREAVEALALDPLLAEAHAAMGVVHARERSWAESQRSFERAIELDPTLTGVYTRYSLWTLRPLGKFDQAERLLATALSNDPLSLDVQREIGYLQFVSDRYDDAIATFERIRGEDPDFPFVETFLGRAMVFAGRMSEGIALLEASEAKGRPGASAGYLAHAYVRAGRRADAMRLAAENAGHPHRETLIYTALGEFDRAFEALDRTAIDEPQVVAVWLTFPELAALRLDPRLAGFRRRFGMPESPSLLPDP